MSGKSQGIFLFFQGQGITREFGELSGKFEKYANVREWSGNFEKSL